MGAGKGLGSCCAKSILIITNIIFFLIGLALFAAGMAIKFANKYIQSYLDQALAGIPSIASSASIANPNSSTGAVTIDTNAFLGHFAIAFIVMGLFITIVGILGMCGACCASKCMLITYALIIFALILVELAVVTIVVTRVLDSKIKDQFKVLVNTKYGGLDTFDAESLLLNVIMLQFKCCGIDGLEDFNTSTSWQKTRTFNQTVGGVVHSQNKTLVTPIACCIMDADFPTGKPIDNNCAFTPNSTNSNYNKGCFQELSSFVVNNIKWPVVGAVTGVLVFELILAILAIVISKSSNLNKSVDSHYFLMDTMKS